MSRTRPDCSLPTCIGQLATSDVCRGSATLTRPSSSPSGLFPRSGALAVSRPWAPSLPPWTDPADSFRHAIICGALMWCFVYLTYSGIRVRPLRPWR
jgi:hypothetical protein